MDNAIIQVKNLRKVYHLGKEKVVALDCINLEIPRGQICCILGTSGSGKSTFLNQLAGLEKPSKGAVLINGTNISKLNERQLAKFRQKNLGFIFQSYNLLPALTALENVAMPLMFRGISRRKRDKRAKELLALVGLKGRMKHKPTQMSGGQQQRVGIARAFVAKPRIVFADEPTGNLDTKTTVEVMQLMVRMAHENNQTLVLVTHDSELAEFCDRIVTLIDGNIVSDRINEHKRTDYIPYQNELAAEAPAPQKEASAQKNPSDLEADPSDSQAGLELSDEGISANPSSGQETTLPAGNDTAAHDRQETEDAKVPAASNPQASESSQNSKTAVSDDAGDNLPQQTEDLSVSTHQKEKGLPFWKRRKKRTESHTDTVAPAAIPDEAEGVSTQNEEATTKSETVREKS